MIHIILRLHVCDFIFYVLTKSDYYFPSIQTPLYSSQSRDDFYTITNYKVNVAIAMRMRTWVVQSVQTMHSCTYHIAQTTANQKKSEIKKVNNTLIIINR